MSNTALLNSYDQVPYPSHPFAASHPDRLATTGTLFGMAPRATDDCRVLEIGCASGGGISSRWRRRVRPVSFWGSICRGADSRGTSAG